MLGVEPVDLRRALTDPSSVDAAILFGTRVSRVLLGAVVGAALAPAGVAFQALLRNPLADPYVLGVSGGASVAATAAIVLGGTLGWLGIWTLPVWSFLGALASVAAVYVFGRVRGRLVPNVALLAGVVLNALSAALIVAIRLLSSPGAAHEALYWLTGSLGPVDGLRLAALGGYVVVGLGVLFMMAVPMNAFALGDEAAHSVGIDTEAARRTIFLAASLLTGAAVAFAGPIGFVGIIVPHVLRGFLGPDHRVLLPASALVGAAFLVAADTAARLAFLVLKTEPTVGVLTALIGAPFFLIVLRRRGMERAG
ncbi:MAG: iron ABC transporter permease [Myxococcales bacterium]|nr:iron ABC transporter permease [Myxococcales bacterium]